MKLTSVEYNSSNDKWYTQDYLPSNSRYILVYSPEFGTSIGFYSELNGGAFNDALRPGEKVGITNWRELPRYVSSQSNL